MKTDTILWLLPIIFMLHDFEEIIMTKPWLTRNAGRLRQKYPRIAARLLPHFSGLSTSAFALAVAEEFVLLSVLTLFAAEYKLYALWAGVTIGFFLHLLAHAVQFLALRCYVPVILTSLPAGMYSLAALFTLNARSWLIWSNVWPAALLATVVILLNVLLAHALAARFDRWLAVYRQPVS